MEFTEINALMLSNVITLFCLLLLCYKLRKKIIRGILEPPHSRDKFMKTINQKGKLLDVGCGNNSPYNIKSQFPCIIYTGIDVGDYNQTKPNLADYYIITSPETFADKISEFENEFDTAICSHNLEHCNDKNKTLEAITRALKSEGYLYLSFPSENSVNFPHRAGCLNYYDDPSHKDIPPRFNEIIEKLKKQNMEIIFAAKSYKPLFMYIRGLLNEYKSKKEKIVKVGTWAYWGFETIIWAKKN
jgi:ubiquinone/menaquinone biosynthesis C-methylase UbiE